MDVTFIGLVLSVMSGAANPQTIYTFKTAEKLQQECTTQVVAGQPLTFTLRSACLAYITAIVDVTETQKASRNISKEFCIPRNATPLDAVKVVTGWMQRQSNLTGAASVATIKALKENYPCA